MPSETTPSTARPSIEKDVEKQAEEPNRDASHTNGELSEKGPLPQDGSHEGESEPADPDSEEGRFMNEGGFAAWSTVVAAYVSLDPFERCAILNDAYIADGSCSSVLLAMSMLSVFTRVRVLALRYLCIVC